MSSARDVSTMNDLDDILVQLDRTRFEPKSDRWITLPGLRSESEFPDADVAPDQSHSHASNVTFSTITTQLKKKKPSQKSKRDRVSAKNILIADRLDRKPYK